MPDAPRCGFMLTLVPDGHVTCNGRSQYWCAWCTKKPGHKGWCYPGNGQDMYEGWDGKLYKGRILDPHLNG